VQATRRTSCMLVASKDVESQGSRDLVGDLLVDHLFQGFKEVIDD